MEEQKRKNGQKMAETEGQEIVEIEEGDRESRLVDESTDEELIKKKSGDFFERTYAFVGMTPAIFGLVAVVLVSFMVLGPLDEMNNILVMIGMIMAVIVVGAIIVRIWWKNQQKVLEFLWQHKWARVMYYGWIAVLVVMAIWFFLAE